MKKISDEEILRLSYKKPHRFGELFDRHHKRFLRIAEKTLRSKDDAEDVVQETFVRIYKYGKNFSKKGGKFRPWSNTILKNSLADQINKYKNVSTSFTEEMEAITASSDLGEGDVDGSKTYVQFVLSKIGGTAAEIIKLRYIFGKSFKEIGKLLNIKSSTARVRAYRSKKIFIKVYKQFNNNYEH